MFVWNVSIVFRSVKIVLRMLDMVVMKVVIVDI